MASVAGLRRLIHHRVDFCRFGGKGDPAFFIEDANALDALLAAQFLHDVVERVAIVVQHFVMRAAQNHIGDAIGGLLDQTARNGSAPSSD